MTGREGVPKDGARERLMASAAAAVGTAIGVVLIEVAPALVREPDLALRPLSAVAFILMLLAVGAIGGWVGHRAFVEWVPGGLIGRALIVGPIAGLAVALTVWTATYVGRAFLLPFELFAGMLERAKGSLLRGIVAGPLIATSFSLLVALRLKRTG